MDVDCTCAVVMDGEFTLKRRISALFLSAMEGSVAGDAEMDGGVSAFTSDVAVAVVAAAVVDAVIVVAAVVVGSGVVFVSWVTTDVITPLMDTASSLKRRLT